MVDLRRVFTLKERPFDTGTDPDLCFRIDPAMGRDGSTVDRSPNSADSQWYMVRRFKGNKIIY